MSQDGRLALVGGSLGSAVVLLTLVEVARDAGITVDAAVVISPVAQLRAAVDATGRGFGVEYPWREETAEVEQRFNFVQRPRQTFRSGPSSARRTTRKAS
ncbi:MAG: hypothetical protein H6512_11775 [Acidimicrobiia bacterium]|nr:hypothetical protein [Acidimicrobiia bacterium]